MTVNLTYQQYIPHPSIVEVWSIMKVPMAGLPIKGLLIAPEGKYSYCIIKDSLSPDLIYKAIGTRNFGCCTRYLGPIPFLVIFDKDAPEESITPIHGPDMERSVIGNVLIFGKDDEDDSFRSLTDFEITTLRNNTVFLHKRGISYFGVNNMTREPTPLNIDCVASDDTPKEMQEISLMKDSED